MPDTASTHTNETLERELSRLRWQCRRGMKELDQLMLRYLELYYLDASFVERNAFKTLLFEFEEPELFALLNGSEVTGQLNKLDSNIANVIKKIRTSPSINYA